MTLPFDLAIFFRAFRQLDPVWLAASVVLVLLTFLGRALRWQVMMAPVAPRAPLGRLFSNTAIGFTASVLFGRAAEIVRPYLIAKAEGVTLSSQLAVWFLERMTDLAMVLLIFGVALTPLDSSAASHVGPQVRWVLESSGRLIGLIGAATCMILLAFRQYSGKTGPKLQALLNRLPAKWAPQAATILDSFAMGVAATRDTRAFALILGYTLVEWALVGACYYCIFMGFPPSAHLSWQDSMVVLGFVTFGSIVQIPGIGGGIQVVAVVVLTQVFGLGLEHATTLGLLLWLIGMVVIVPLGLVLAVHNGLSLTSLVKLPRAPEK